ncbi:MAG: hypothetical protein Q8R14_04555 [Candidatus Omnitrophota bacterium]|nr:hypothetical protein [Candidatus Omnitrophota bacterium]
MCIIAIVFLIFYLLIFKKHKPVSVGECSLVFLLIILLCLGQNGLEKFCKQWEKYGGAIGGPGFSWTFNGPPKAPDEILKENSIEAEYTGYDKTRLLIKESIAKREAIKNLINNGDFKIPLGNKLSKWGHGLHSDSIKAMYPGVDFVWFNFLNADIDISVEETEIGNALKIIHKSEEMNNRIGLMEQRLQVVPGRYRLSFWAKELYDFQGSALWFVTTDNWVIEENGAQRGYDLNKKGTFGWEYFFKEIQVDKSGDITFSIVSIGKGTVYIADISFIKQ